ncbi:ogdh [Symbiodinium microadriaticum]|nr:ogdh [Symbiodinium microadriaticum]
MCRKHVSADTVSHNAVISAFEKAGEWQRAMLQLQMMSEEKLSPDIISHNALISACARAGKWEAALGVFVSRLRAGGADAHSLTAALSALALAGLWGRALALLEETKLGSLSPSCAVCNAAMGACDVAGQWQRALLLLASMPRQQIKADRISRVTAISTCGQASQRQLALALRRTADGASSAAAAASACGSASQWTRALAIIDALPEASLDEVCYGAVIRACEAPRKWSLAVALVEEMCSKALRVNEICISAAVAASRDVWCAALALLQLAPSEAGYGAAIRACQGATEWVAALGLFADFREEIGQDSLAIATLTMSACAQANQWQQVLSLAELLSQDEVGYEAAEIGTSLSVALAECELRSLPFVERRLLVSLGRQSLDPTAAQLLRLSGGWRRDLAPLTATLAVLQGPAAAAAARSYHREVSLLRRVVDKALPGDVSSILGALNDFGEELEWAKFAGGSKGEAIVAAVRGALPFHTASRNLGILEIGTYCGNSALRMASALPGVLLTSLELDPVYVAIARCLLGFAGLSDQVKVWTGHSHLLLPTLKARLQHSSADPESLRFGALLIDRWGTEYDEDLDMIEKHQLMAEHGGIVVADNVLSTAAANYLWRTSAHAASKIEGADGAALCYTSQVVSVTEVADRSQEDWVSVAVSTGRGAAEDLQIPEELAELNQLSACLRPRVVGPWGGQVAAAEMPQLAAEAKVVLSRHKLGPMESKEHRDDSRTSSPGSQGITGQDVQRGTFAHRHCVIKDQQTGADYCFLNNLNLGPQETFIARNSILAEYGVVGFELGYSYPSREAARANYQYSYRSYENPTALVVWEAQFGDFANTAQVPAEHHRARYMGQGAEHSSCRIERFLQSSDDDEDDIPDFKDGFGRKANWQVMNLSTPANYFHALRRQQHRDFRQADTRFQRLIGERDPEIAGNPDKVERLIFCSGKIYYELVAERERLGLKNVAIVTIEQLAPFPFDRVKQVMANYKNVDAGDGVHPGQFVWCQVTTAREGFDTDLWARIPAMTFALFGETSCETVTCAICHKQVRAGLLPNHQERCYMLCELRAWREREFCRENAEADKVKMKKDAATSCLRMSWSQVPSPRCTGDSFLKECPGCGKQMLSHSLRYHQSRCPAAAATQGATKQTGDAQGSKALLTPRPQSASPSSSPNSSRRQSWADVTPPRSARGPCTVQCQRCGRQVLRTSQQQHEARCRPETTPKESKGPGNPYRRASWSDVSAPKVARPSCHAPSPTEKCPSCHRYVACSGLQAHVQRCQKLSRRFEEMQRHPTLLGGVRREQNLVIAEGVTRKLHNAEQEAIMREATGALLGTSDASASDNYSAVLLALNFRVSVEVDVPGRIGFDSCKDLDFNTSCQSYRVEAGRRQPPDHAARFGVYSCRRSCSSGVEIDQTEALLQHLAMKGSICFHHIAVWHQASWMGVVDHHTLVYEYFSERRLRSLKIDWGKDGFFFADGSEDPCPAGDVLSRKMCRVTGMEVCQQLERVTWKKYDLMKWNCQQFCRHMFEQVPEVFTGSASTPGA